MVRALLLPSTTFPSGLAHFVLLVSTAKSDMLSYHVRGADRCGGLCCRLQCFGARWMSKNLDESAMCCLPPCARSQAGTRLRPLIGGDILMGDTWDW